MWSPVPSSSGNSEEAFLVPIISREKFEEIVKNCLATYCDEKVSDTTRNVDPDGYLKVRTVTWYYKPYTFEARCLLTGIRESPIFAPLGFIAKLDGDAEEEKLRSTHDLAKKITKANLMREAGIV